MTDSPFGPVRKWGNEPRWDPNDMLELDRETQWQSIREAFGETVCLDTGVPHEASHDERRMALLSYKPMGSAANTVALQTAPVVPTRNPVFRGIAYGLMGSLIIAAAVVGVVNVALWVMS